MASGRSGVPALSWLASGWSRIPEADRVAVVAGVSWAVSFTACVLSATPCRVAVKGLSMAPTLLPGDHLLVTPTRRLRRRDLVVVVDPTEPGRHVVKRVVALPGESVSVEGRMLTAGPRQIVVLGDNLDRSTDSRDYGPVGLDAVHGRVWYRYAPPARAAAIPRSA
jgi:signal peptidase I